MKLTQFVDMAYKGLRVPGPLTEYKGVEIEHILPNNPKAELRADFTQQNPEANYDEYKNKLGNLTPLEKPLNIIAGNDFFAIKRAKYTQCKYYLTSSIAGLAEVGNNSSITRINAKLASFDDWTAASIDHRQNLLIGLTKDIWKITPIET
jgi:hypothetical protein